jgi:hypothetical protein
MKSSHPPAKSDTEETPKSKSASVRPGLVEIEEVPEKKKMSHQEAAQERKDAALAAAPPPPARVDAPIIPAPPGYSPQHSTNALGQVVGPADVFTR